MMDRPYLGTTACIDPQMVRIFMVCEKPPEKAQDYFYSSSDSLYVKNTVDAFNSAGIKVTDINDIISRGVYLTIAVKTPVKETLVPLGIIREQSRILEMELKMFPNIKAILLMGDTAIKALNCIALNSKKARIIPAGPTYKIRKGEFFYNGIRVFPSYLQTGKNFLIEKSKRQMVAEDIKNAFNLLEDEQTG
jgi:uracil-DNA glycosylase